MKKVLKLLCLALCVVLALGCFSGCGKEKAYVIGFSGPLSGDASVYGDAVKNSAQMAIDEINEAGGLNGVKFKLEAIDDKNDTSNIQTNFATLMDKGMQVSLGTVTTKPGLAFSEASKDEVFFITPSASGDDIPKYDNGFQMCFADSNQGIAAADYVNKTDYKEIGVFYKSDDPYSDGIYKKFKENLDSSIKVVETAFTDATSTDFSTQINKLKNCKFIFMPIYYTPASVFMQQATNKVAKDTVYYGWDGFDGIESAEGFDINAIPQEVTMLSHFNSKATDGAAADFIKKYTEKYGKETLNQFGASAYDCVYAIFNAMKKAVDEGTEIPVNISAKELLAILQKQFTGDFKYSGNTGTDITWEDSGYVSKSAVQYVIKEASK